MESIERVKVDQRVYLNAFPKAGLHLAELFVRMTAAPVDNIRWLGTFDDNAWTNELYEPGRFPAMLEALPAGGYLKGHCGYFPDIAEALWERNIATLFVYRDLRDVVISQAYHILNTEPADDGYKLKHPGRDLFLDMPFEDVVVACIEGHDKYPGIVERWSLYQDWLNERWVLPLRYADMVNRPEETGSRILRYVVGQTAAFYGLQVTLNKKDHDQRVREMLDLIDRHTTVTFRRGKAGGWVDDWTDRIQAAWLESGADEMNTRLINGA